MLLHPFWLHVKSLLASPTRYLRTRATSPNNLPIVARWSDPAMLLSHWDERTAMMAGMIAPESTVLEFGAGNERMRDFLHLAATTNPPMWWRVHPIRWCATSIPISQPLIGDGM